MRFPRALARSETQAPSQDYVCIYVCVYVWMSFCKFFFSSIEATNNLPISLRVYHLLFLMNEEILRYLPPCHHYHHVVPPARIFLTLSRHFSLSFIASGRSSGLHPVSSHSCCMYVRTGRPAFARPFFAILKL